LVEPEQAKSFLKMRQTSNTKEGVFDSKALVDLRESKLDSLSQYQNQVKEMIEKQK
jgi:hypothetical protein